MNLRIGQGYDAHKLVPGDGMTLGGVKISSDYSIEAHSDGDIIIHALMDSLLGASGLGDLGSFFGTSEDSLKDVSSRDLLKRIVSKFKEDNISIINVDITYIGEVPKVIEHVGLIRENLSKDLEIEKMAVSCKATTTDGMGFEGKKSGISCLAVSLIRI
tara:strand:- start:7239 stop:7715 length:477 start_codon:yes stop_codon:yes gene_type:complete